ncbi:hypothetical protein SDC9_146392 [bioreactor metagenome]|uniref:Uncharacterized protein n=1 Tax=bioreactor metagenome TaxID=1076179 RepID=A0A645ECX4_9ZZZZ
MLVYLQEFKQGGSNNGQFRIPFGYTATLSYFVSSDNAQCIHCVIYRVLLSIYNFGRRQSFFWHYQYIKFLCGCFFEVRKYHSNFINIDDRRNNKSH